MDFDFGQISDMLGNMSEEEMQNLQDAAQSLFSSFGGDDGGPQPPPGGYSDEYYSNGYQSGGYSHGGNSGGGGGFGGDFGSMFTPEMLGRLSQIMQRMNCRDKRTDLIMALKPHLSHRRQHRAEQAVQMMKMLELMPTLQEAMR